MKGVAKKLFLRLEPLQSRFVDLSSFVDLIFLFLFLGRFHIVITMFSSLCVADRNRCRAIVVSLRPHFLANMTGEKRGEIGRQGRGDNQG